MAITWHCKLFDELSLLELHNLLKLRTDVFVVEQNCPYAELDGKDTDAWHIMGVENDKLIAYARILSPGTSYAEASVGRVVISPHVRGKKIGYELMGVSLEFLYQKCGNVPVRIGAQVHLQAFYEKMGFLKASEPYLEDGIPHLEMTLNSPD